MMLEKSPADIFLRNPCIVTNTAWKLEVIVSNLTKFIDKHFSDFTIAFAAGYMDTVLSMPISVEEEDSMIGTPDLIRNKARDQVLKMWSMSIDRERRDLVPHEFNQIVEEGGEFGTIASDVAAREIWITENNQKVGNWRRVLNFHFSKPAGKMTAKEMRKEMDEYCDSEYGTLGRKASRAVDATIGLTNVVFPVRTAIHKKQEIYVPPQEVFVFAGRETAGITMDVHPLSDQNHRAQFFADHVARCKENGMSEKDAYSVFEGRAGLGRMEDFIIYCQAHNIKIDVQLPESQYGDQLHAIKEIAEGGSYKLLAAVMLYANTHPYPQLDGGFVVTREPKNASNILV
jgi:hypothetical protein